MNETPRITDPSGQVARGCVQRLVRRKYTRITKYSDGYAAYLQIDHQGFCVVDNTTRERANWYRDQLAAALSRLISSNNVLGGLVATKKDTNALGGVLEA
jgi:hypothetical protein